MKILQTKILLKLRIGDLKKKSILFHAGKVENSVFHVRAKVLFRVNETKTGPFNG